MGIKKKDILNFLKESKKESLNFEDIQEYFHIHSKPRKKLMPILKSLASSGDIIFEKDKISLISGVNETVIGEFIKAKDGYGFIVSPDEKEDLYISAQEVMWNGIMNGDTIRVRKKFDRKKKQVFGEFIDFVSRRSNIVVGKLISYFGHFAIQLRRTNDLVLIEHGRLKGARNNDVVEGVITSWPFKKQMAKGEVVKKLDIDIDLVIRDHGLRDKFSDEIIKRQEIIKEPNQSKEKYDLDFVLDENKIKRKNLSNILTFTIDGIDAKDFDDAISYEKTDKEHILYVSIADVSNYILKNDVIDKEASLRTSSIYFPGFVIPMLPSNISNNICSLQEGKYRYTMTAEIYYSLNGNIKSYKVYPSVIKSQKRLNYEEVQKIIDPKTQGLREDVSVEDISKDIKEKILLMYEFYKILEKKSNERGKLNLDISEANIILDEKGNIIDVEKRKNFSSHKLIEEFMIQANIAAASLLKEKGIYRVHEDPSEEKMYNFSKIVSNYKENFTLNKISAKALSSFLLKIKNKPYEKLLNIVLLRSLKKAKYDSLNLGHFALGLKTYTHFTSPIRRYPDLIVHRLLKKLNSYTKEELKFISEACSTGEIKAQKAERDITKIKQARFLEKRIGETFKATVSGFSSNFMYVELKDYFIEGKLSFSSIGRDFFIFNESKMELMSENKKKRYALGDEITVVLKSVDVFSGEILFIYKG